MSRPTPAFVYALAILLILWLVVGAITLPNATKWFKGVPAKIQQDIIVIPANGTSISTHLQLIHGEWKYNEKLVVSDNVPNPPDEGMQGMLYDRGNSCSLELPDLIPFHVPPNIPPPTKVALIKRSDCPFSQQLLNAQQDGAKAAIVYDNVSFENDSRAKYGMDIPPDTIYIPAFYVDLSVGLELFARLQNISGDDKSISGQEKLENGMTALTRVTLFPPQKPRLDPWQFALIIIGVVVVTSLAIIVAMQCHLWRLGRRRGNTYNNDVADDEHDVQDAMDTAFTAEERFWREIISQDPNFVYRPPQKYHLLPEMLDTLPTHIVSQKKETEQSPSSSTAASTQNLSIKNVSEVRLKQQKQQQQQQQQQHTTCVICLDAMEDGEIVRTLPCFHEYHRDCIDTWLTKKSAVCPLCLQSVITPMTPENVRTRQQVLQREAAEYLRQPTTAEETEMNELMEIYQRLTRETTAIPQEPSPDINAAQRPQSRDRQLQQEQDSTE